MEQIPESKARGQVLKPCSGYANIVSEPTGYHRAPIIRVYRAFKENGVVTEKVMQLPRYDMHTVNPHRARFFSPDFREDLYKQCLATTEGRRIVARLRNEKTNSIVNKFIKYEQRDVKVDLKKLAQGHVGKLIEFVKSVARTPRVPTPPVSNRVLGLTVEEIWETFKKSGLLTKLLTLKKENYGSRPTKGEAHSNESHP